VSIASPIKTTVPKGREMSSGQIDLCSPNPQPPPRQASREYPDPGVSLGNKRTPVSHDLAPILGGTRYADRD